VHFLSDLAPEMQERWRETHGRETCQPPAGYAADYVEVAGATINEPYVKRRYAALHELRLHDHEPVEDGKSIQLPSRHAGGIVNGSQRRGPGSSSTLRVQRRAQRATANGNHIKDRRHP
jgi:hypothetical protein